MRTLSTENLQSVVDQYHRLKEEVESLCIQLGRKEPITLVLVSKLQPVEKILALYQVGHRDFGENYVQHLIAKAEQLPPDIHWHLIGHLQTNKVKKVVPYLHCLHTLDREKLVAKLESHLEKPLPCFIQIHIAQEATKSGAHYAEVPQLIETVLEHAQHIRLIGFMGIATYTEDANQIRKEFRELRRFQEKMKAEYGSEKHPLNQLCIGMSHDYRIAIEEGATVLRIGTLVFGKRV